MVVLTRGSVSAEWNKTMIKFTVMTIVSDGCVAATSQIYIYIYKMDFDQTYDNSLGSISRVYI